MSSALSSRNPRRCSGPSSSRTRVQAFRPGVAGATWAACLSQPAFVSPWSSGIATTYPVGSVSSGTRALSRRSCGGRRRTGVVDGAEVAVPPLSRVQGSSGRSRGGGRPRRRGVGRGRAEVGEWCGGRRRRRGATTARRPRRYWTFWSPGLGWVPDCRCAVAGGCHSGTGGRVPQERSADNGRDAAGIGVDLDDLGSSLDDLDRANRDVVDRHLTGVSSGDVAAVVGVPSRRAGRLRGPRLTVPTISTALSYSSSGETTTPIVTLPWLPLALDGGDGSARVSDAARVKRAVSVFLENAANGDSSAGARRRSCRSSVWSPGRLSWLPGRGSRRGTIQGRVGRGP